MTADEYCQQKAAASGSSFYYSFLFLPPPRRRAITALYAYCREVDDVVDEVTDPGVAQTKLAWWRNEIEQLFAGNPQHPVTRALQPHLEAFGITRERLLQVIEGMQMDLQQSRYLDFANLKRYCHLVAGVVGELSAGIFGASDERTYEYARQMGLALQLVNILRDVGEDARRGRVYLPIADLQAAGVKVSDVINGQYVDGFDRVMRQQAVRAREAYRAALAALPDADRRAQRPGLIMGAIYLTLLDEIEREDFRVLHQRVALTPLRKLAIAWRTWVVGPPARLARD
ncbi:MAG: presqualene diphosphate synthase HpnD [Burkholderiaceae bacterium]|jgi:phytoene synthase|nr:presqualene diphosphate synthase HpnD [Burkholderiaceae bacterium]